MSLSLSWTSSMIMWVHSAIDFLAMSIFIKRPVVTNIRRVSLEAFSLSKPTLYPIRPPSLQPKTNAIMYLKYRLPVYRVYDDVPLSSATRLAKAWAANFLGWVTIIFTYLKNKPSKCRLIRVSLKSITYLSWAANWSNKNCGTWVLLPQPVEPETTVTQCASILAKRSFAHLKTGKDRRLISAERSMSNLALQKKLFDHQITYFIFNEITSGCRVVSWMKWWHCAHLNFR